ncbi:MAG: hypothetical protein L0228_01215 [Planctomycetes bacterium]|nr:hypothetical protein [Planctomycetota bacterium]
MLRHSIRCAGVVVVGVILLHGGRAGAERPRRPAAVSTPKAADPSPRQAELEAAFSKMLSNATLEGSFTSTGEGVDPTKLSREKYTLGDVKKIEGNFWLIPARIQYGEHDVTIPLLLPVRWAGDTPVIVVDDVGLPGFGTVSARVMFFADHYAGYWKHGKHGGHLFGVIRRDEKAAEANNAEKKQSPSSGNSSGGKQEKKQPGEQ